MNLYKKLTAPVIILVLLISGIDSEAQQPPVELKPDQFLAVNWTTDDGLSIGIHCMIKDVNGFLWVGGLYGTLNRFDGARFEKYPSDKKKSGMVRFDIINSLVEDSLRNLWIGFSMGLARYDIRADTFTYFTPFIDSINVERSIIPFWCTGNALYCLEYGSRIVEYDIHSFQKRNLLSLTEKEINAVNQPNQTILDPATHSLWMLEGGDGDPEHPGGGLFNISLVDGKRSHYGWACFRNIQKHDHGSEAMRLDTRRNSIWINSPDGLIEFSLSDKHFHFIDAFSEYIKLKDYGRFVGVDIDKAGKVWLATKPKGILIYDPESRQISQPFPNSDLQVKTGENNMQIYCDRDGIVWCSFWDNRGIYELLPYHPSVTFYPANPNGVDSLKGRNIFNIVPSDHNQIWIATDAGLKILHPNTGKFEVLKGKDLRGFTGEDIVPIYIDTVHQKAWICSEKFDTVFEMDMQTRQRTPIIFRDGSKQIDSLNIEWPLTQPYKNGLLVYDMNHGFFEIKEGSPFADLFIPFSGFVGRCVLKEDRFLFLKNPNFPPNYSFENINGKWVKTLHLMDSLNWDCMFYNKKDHTTWVSVGDEFLHYDNYFRKLKSYGSEEENKGIVVNMLTDDSGHLWYINWQKQVGRLDTTTGIITTLSTADGYQAQFFDWFSPGAKDNLGNLYFGESPLGTGKVGLIRIDPKKYDSMSPAIVYFKSLSINNKKFPVSTGVNNIKELPLSYDQNSVSIETGIIDYYSIGKSRLRYKLEGNRRAEDWHYGSAYYTVRYEGLAPGNYRLVLQASNAANEFNGPEKILSITITPPWWQTWWARSAFVLGFIFLLWRFIQYRSKSLKQRNIALEDKVLHRTKELKHSLEELRATQVQLIQREKMASLGELTAGIAHEIQNPLNFVNNFSDINTELIDEMNEEIKSGDLQEATKVAGIIKDNNLKINHHGRRADSIVKGMLQHSRSSSGQKEPADINALADEYLRLSYHGLRAKDKTFNATMITDYDKNAANINIVSQDIGRVLLNLYNNSFYSVNEKKKIQPPGYEPTLWVSTRQTGYGMEIRIKDNGMGIPQKIQDKIFQPFFTTKPTGEGTGLGLSLSYEIITKGHGGELKMDSKESEYVEFTILLPIVGS